MFTFTFCLHLCLKIKKKKEIKIFLPNPTKLLGDLKPTYFKICLTKKEESFVLDMCYASRTTCDCEIVIAVLSGLSMKKNKVVFIPLSYPESYQQGHLCPVALSAFRFCPSQIPLKPRSRQHLYCLRTHTDSYDKSKPLKRDS